MSDIQFWSTCKIGLDDCMGGDLRIVQKARGTVGKTAKTMPEWGPNLIGRLMKNRHGTPFEAAVLEFDIECPIFVAREWFRHRIGSFNEFSMRVADAPPVFYMPAEAAVRREVGRYEYETMHDDDVPQALDYLHDAYESAWCRYRELLEHGVARELARTVLPVGIYTHFGWTVNARALMNFIALRTAPDAMLEIREAAQMVEKLFKDAMPHTWNAFDSFGRVAP